MNLESMHHLTMREQQALQVLLDKRDVYRAEGRRVYAHAIGVALWLVWHVFTADRERPP
jgi:hypothetical protein